MPTANLALLDTSVYIENFRTGRFTLITCNRKDFLDIDRHIPIKLLFW